MNKQIRFLDTTLRDGEQTPGIHMSTAAKVEIATQLARLRVDVIEAGFPAVSEREAFRQISYAGLACEKTIMGQGLDGYRQAIEYLVNKYHV